MFLFAIFCKIGALECKTYWFHVELFFITIFDQSFKVDHELNESANHLAKNSEKKTRKKVSSKTADT